MDGRDPPSEVGRSTRTSGASGGESSRSCSASGSVAYLQQKSITVAAVPIMPELGLTQLQMGWLEQAYAQRVCDLYDSRRTPRAAVGRPGHARADGFDRFPRDARHAACALAARRSIVVCVAARLAVSIGYRPGPYLSSLRGRIRDLVPAEPMGPGGRTFRPWGCSSGRR